MAVAALALFGLLACGKDEKRAAAAPPALRVCADPNNLPFSNARGEGFENKLAQLVSRELRQPLSYSWRPQRRAFVRNTINADVCDLIIGVPSSFERTRATIPYYRSTYVFVTRRGGPKITSFDDPVLRKLRIGVQLIGDDYSNAPPAQALANRGIIKNVKGYSVYGDYSLPNPPSTIIDAVAAGDIDVAIVWGPLAGYFAPRAGVPLTLTPVSPQIDLPYLPFVFDISMGVKRGNDSLRERLDSVIVKRSAEIERILDQYGVPRA